MAIETIIGVPCVCGHRLVSHSGPEKGVGKKALGKGSELSAACMLTAIDPETSHIMTKESRESRCCSLRHMCPQRFSSELSRAISRCCARARHAPYRTSSACRTNTNVGCVGAGRPSSHPPTPFRTQGPWCQSALTSVASCTQS
jgi:hypothetical protein